MKTTFSVDSNNDIFINEDGLLDISSDINAVKFICENVAKARLGEMIYQQDNGLPYFQAVFTSNPNIERFRNALRNSLLSIDGVDRILSIDLSLQNHVISYTATILFGFEEIIINGPV